LACFESLENPLIFFSMVCAYRYKGNARRRPLV